MKNLLIVGKGNSPYTDRTPQRLLHCALNKGLDAKRCDYNELSQAPAFNPGPLQVMLFFPYAFWDAHCEQPHNSPFYGTSTQSYRLFKRYLFKAHHLLKNRYYGHNPLQQIIHPRTAALDRDKLATLQCLKRYQVPCAHPIYTRHLPSLLALLQQHSGLYIKCRYGAEGKGITVLRHHQWQTNYPAEPQQTPSVWPFRDITGQHAWLQHLLEQAVTIEPEIIPPPCFNGQKWDVRVYLVNGQMVHFFVRLNQPQNLITNYSQGAQVLHHPHTGLTAATQTLLAQVAQRTAKAMNAHFLGVDIMFHQNLAHPMVLEAQSFCDFPSIDRFNLADYLSQNIANNTKKSATI